jgi:S1-C subfamily serine protease
MRKALYARPLAWMGLLVILLSLSALGCLSPTALTQTPEEEPPAQDSPAAPQPTREAAVEPAPSSAVQPITIGADGEEALLVELYKRINPAVVHIRIYTAENLLLGSGSGFVVDTNRHVVTNNHVVQDADKIEVVFSDATRTEGHVIGSDIDADLAVLELDEVPSGLAPLPLGNSDAVQVGQRVIAIGNPFGLAGTMTVGIISGVGRDLRSQRVGDVETQGTYSNPDVIQTDAAINPGNSGGPLLNSRGEVIGINTAIRSTSGTNSGVGFAAPVNTIVKLLPHLIEDGQYVYPWLGLTGQTEIDLFTAEELGLPQSQGVLVIDVTAGGPSDEAGLREGDLIIQIDDEPLTDFGDLISYLVAQTEPGQVIDLTLIRNGETLQLSVTLGERP